MLPQWRRSRIVLIIDDNRHNSMRMRLRRQNGYAMFRCTYAAATFRIMRNVYSAISVRTPAFHYSTTTAWQTLWNRSLKIAGYYAKKHGWTAPKGLCSVKHHDPLHLFQINSSVKWKWEPMPLSATRPWNFEYNDLENGKYSCEYVESSPHSRKISTVRVCSSNFP